MQLKAFFFEGSLFVFYIFPQADYKKNTILFYAYSLNSDFLLWIWKWILLKSKKLVNGIFSLLVEVA